MRPSKSKSPSSGSARRYVPILTTLRAGHALGASEVDELPRHASFDNLDKIFEGLVSLRPRRFTELLTACRSVKVRRLFFVFADRHGHGWREHVDASAIDLGSGPGALVDGGRFRPAYRIFVPEMLMPADAVPPNNGSMTRDTEQPTPAPLTTIPSPPPTDPFRLNSRGKRVDPARPQEPVRTARCREVQSSLPATRSAIVGACKRAVSRGQRAQ